MKFIKPLSSLTLADIPSVGGKAASLGQLIAGLSHTTIRVPDGFAITVDAYWYVVQKNKLQEKIAHHICSITNYSDLSIVHEQAQKIRDLFLHAEIPGEVVEEIAHAYEQLSQNYQQNNLSVAVRSSATAEDLPTASFAGQQESFLNITNIQELLAACKECFASLFTDRAMIYRHEQSFDHQKIALAIVVQKMVRSDRACAGVAFSLDTESGFKKVVTINAVHGLGQSLVQGMVVPDEYVVFKPTLATGHRPLIKKICGSKTKKIVYETSGIAQKEVPLVEQRQWCLSDDEILALSRSVCAIEDYYSQLNGRACAMDIEWAKDGIDNKIYIVQARQETIHKEKKATITHYALRTNALVALVTGQSVGSHIVHGTVRIITSIEQAHSVRPHDILVTTMTDPDWMPLLKKCRGIITQMGGRTCHAAIVSRELNIPALVGAPDALQLIDGMDITLDCSQGTVGYVYHGHIAFEKKEIALSHIPASPVPLMLNLADPDRAFSLSFLPVDGVGLARMEFIISSTIKIHPLAVCSPEKITDAEIVKKIDELTASYLDPKSFYIDTLAQGIGTIAAAFYPKPVIVRLSDFKTNEYRNLIGGHSFEPEEENPMIGFRGAIRYYTAPYDQAFALECAALKKVRQEMGLDNVQIMVPFVRTVQESKKVVAQLGVHGLVRGQHNLKVIMMCEIPANVILIDEFLEDFDGISIGSNDLTQLTLGVDRDSGSLTTSFDERDPAVKKMIALAIAGANRAQKYSGICGQAPSDYPEIAEYVISLGIHSISLNPDSVIPFLMRKIAHETKFADIQHGTRNSFSQSL